MHRPWFLILLCSAACGADPKPPASPTQETAATANQPAAAPTASGSTAPATELTPRQKETALILKVFADPQTPPEPPQRARLAANGLDQGGGYGLPKEQLRALTAVAGNDVDPSQCGRILLQAVESAKPVVEKRCGSFDALKKTVENATGGFGHAKEAKVKAMIQACKITKVPDKEIPMLDPWALLASAVVSDELAASGQSNDDEQKIAAALAYVCTPQ